MGWADFDHGFGFSVEKYIRNHRFGVRSKKISIRLMMKILTYKIYSVA